MLAILLKSFILVSLVYNGTGFQKVVVPAVYDEWHIKGPPDWITNSSIKEKYNYTTFIYQKMNSSEPNYIPTNRGRENGPYYQYIIDHYDDFPDVAIFVHARPHEHQPKFLEMIGCINPNATYMSINHQRFYRNTNYWQNKDLWV